ncbi:MAG: helix-turn-helix transcriptional regulator [Verrucomicrobia bacterium]|nr:helix-turn-helix transcriptional regulator [Verrucomicrobiota bacterium]
MQATPVSQLRIYQEAPSPALSRIIKRFLVIEFPSLHRDVHLPETNAVAAFSFRGACQIDGTQLAPAAAFTGPRDFLRTHEHRQSHAVLLAIFAPVGAHTFLRLPLDAVAGSTVSLAELIGRPDELHRLNERLNTAETHRQRVALVEQFLLAKMRSSTPDPLMSAAVDWLERGTTDAKRIDHLARYIGLSQSALERRFKRIIGVSPKQFVSLARLRWAAQLQATGADLTTVAHTSGYFDQSHFIKEFRRATGSAPSAFFRRTD